MINVILSNLESIKKRHYAQKAKSTGYWVAFYESVLNRYKAQFGEDFNLIIYGDENLRDDFFSIPYIQLKDFLTEPHIDEQKRRWVFSIENNILRAHRNPKRVDIMEFRGNIIDIQPLYQYQTVKDLNKLQQRKEDTFQKDAEWLSQEELMRRIQSLDRGATHREGTTKYYQRRAIVSEYAKRRANGICQLCQHPAPFVDIRNKPYLEAHHVIWLSRNGDDTPENTAALCPNCHRKMHILNITSDQEIILSRISGGGE
ncbi:MAG: HNH endonuclease [Methanoregula sp.]|uniref:HNH endonuclease n=1 Tax=Methanoregula sp. TaxID=2052170 RepID=UPI003BB0D220